MAFFGPNGIGKTTLLRMIAGLESFHSGEIVINGKLPSNAKIGYIPQDYTKTLLPWYTVRENIILPLTLNKKATKEKQRIFEKVIDDFSVELPWEAYPYSLSGGQQQMIVILRSIINNPDILLMDEPFSSLDLQTSLKVQKKLLQVLRQKKLTTLFVSHRTEEGLFLSNRILVLRGKPVMIVKDLKNNFSYSKKSSANYQSLFE